MHLTFYVRSLFLENTLITFDRFSSCLQNTFLNQSSYKKKKKGKGKRSPVCSGNGSFHKCVGTCELEKKKEEAITCTWLPEAPSSKT